MRIVVLGNFPTQGICKQQGMTSLHKEGWVEACLCRLALEHDIIYIFPQDISKRAIEGSWESIRYIGFFRGVTPKWKYSVSLENRIGNVMETIGAVDVIHIMGTEYGHTLAMINYLEKTKQISNAVVAIQGLVNICACYYLRGIPCRVKYRWTLSDVKKKSNLKLAQYFYMLRGNNEVKALKKCKYVIGRTDFDLACVKQINKEIKYYYCGEILRKSFYQNSWELDKCKKNTIFVSQGNYPIKGFHYLIKALAIVKEEVPDVEVRITGKNLLCDKHLNSYEKYVKDLIKRYDCERNIVFLNVLSEREMVQQYKNANVFVSPSVIENSSNSIGEAMIIGTPIIASDVGGTNSLIEHKKNGFLYQYDAYYMLAHYILLILKDDGVAVELSEQEKKRGISLYNPDNICFDLQQIYKTICSINKG